MNFDLFSFKAPPLKTVYEKNKKEVINMRLGNVKNSQERLEQSPYFIKNPKEYKGKWHTLFKNQNPIHLEIGTGKGNFLITMAKKYPEINFIGMEKFSSVLLRATEKVENESLPNLYFICEDAKEIQEIFDHEISTIYLNFSDPWPKKRHEKRRLTSRNYLSLYENVFKEEKRIVQKTDNIGLFAFSLEELSKMGYILNKVSLDLKNEDILNVVTEYEEKFSQLGFKINYVEAIKHKDS